MPKNGFIKKSISTLTLGEKLKKFRNERRMTLGEASRLTRIKIEYLKALEEGDYDSLPVEVYVKGFLRSYANCLGVDEQALIRLYEKERGIKTNIEKVQKAENGKKDIEPINISPFVLTPRIMVIAAITVLTLASFFYIYREIGSFSDAPRLVILNPEQGSQIQDNSVVVEGITEKDARLFINDQPILVNDEGKFREDLTLQNGDNVINIKSVNKFDKETSQVLTVAAHYQVEENQSGSESSQEEREISRDSQKLEMEIRVDPGPVWLSVETDDNLVFSGTMLSGATQKFSAENKITVNSGKANATFVIYNGKDIGALGSGSGPVRGVVFNRDTQY
jgi:cytoskeleton protein RodZ